jgi:peptidoglycan hydrolase CwlO-like protein
MDSEMVNRMQENIKNLQEDNEELRNIIAEQNGKLERAIQAIYQLHGGLYNQRTQEETLHRANAHLFGSKVPEPNKNEDSYNETIWVTTRQGDNHAIQLDRLEKKIEVLTADFKRVEASLTRYN